MLHAEDLYSGLEFQFSSWTVTEEEILEFARKWDPLTIHTDPPEAAKGPFGGVIASGLHTMAIYQRLAVEALWTRISGVAGRRFDVRFTSPVRPGETLTGFARVDRVLPRRDPATAVMVATAQLIDTHDTTVLDLTLEAVVNKRVG